MANTSTIKTRPATVEASDTVTRVADTTPYAAADAWTDHATTPTAAGILAFRLAGRDGGGGVITDMQFTRSVPGATNADFDVVLLDASPTLTGDNLAFVLTDAEALNILGVVSIAAADWKVSTLNAFCHKPNLNIGFVCASGSQTIYGAIVVRGAYTPTSAEVFGARVKARQD